MTIRRLACLMTTMTPIFGATTDERLSLLEKNMAELQSLVQEIAGGSRREIEAPPSRGPSESKSPGGVYHVRSGDSYWSISRRLGISVKALEQANPNVNPKRLPIGAALNLPGHPGDSGTRSVAGTTGSHSGNGKYTVKRGDILGRISEAHGIRLHQLMSANPGLDARRLQIGQVLTIPGQPTPRKSERAAIPNPPEEFLDELPDLPAPGESTPPIDSPASDVSDPASIDEAPTVLVTVNENTRLAEIASRHRTSVAVLNYLNAVDLSPEQMIKTGSQLYVPGR